MWMILNGQTGIFLVAIVCITIIVFTIIITRTIKYCSDKKYETIQEYNKVNTHNNETYADAKNKYIKTMKENDIRDCKKFCVNQIQDKLYLSSRINVKINIDPGGYFYMGFSLLRAEEFFVFRKMEMPETKIHLLCGWSQIVIQKITFPLQ